MQLLPRRLPALFSCGLLLLEAACLAAAATAFVVAPPAAGPALPPPQRGTVLMMAQRHYVKHTRADFLLKSALAVRAHCDFVAMGWGRSPSLVGSCIRVLQKACPTPEPLPYAIMTLTDRRLRSRGDGPEEGWRCDPRSAAAPRHRAPPTVRSRASAWGTRPG